MAVQSLINRRAFLKGAAGSVAAGTVLPTLLPSAVLGQQGRRSPNQRVTLGIIGTGNLGARHHLGNVLLGRQEVSSRVDVAAVCDVDANRRDEAARMVKDKTGRRIEAYTDFRRLLDRKDIDAVFVVTPDHWHALIAIAAMEAGKDVYCEKPLALTIEEGQAMVAAARRYGTVFQTGSMQRSGQQFRHAVEIVRSGKLGKIRRVDTVLHCVGTGTWEPQQTPPDELDYNFWLGPAPFKEYHSNLVHYQFRWQYDYSGGVMTDWGAHHNDIVQWALGMDETGPVQVTPQRALWNPDGPYDVPRQFDVHYKYANGIDLYCHTNAQEYEDGTQFGLGVKFTGTDGWLFVSRRDIQASDPAIIQMDTRDIESRFYENSDHHRNWLDCIESRQQPVCDVEIGHRSASMCHIGNIALRLGRSLKWNPEREEFTRDEAANRMLGKPMRGPWHL